MAKLSKAKEMYHLKNEELDSCGTKVTPKEFYRDLFPVGSFERKMKYDDQKPNGIVLEILDDGKRVVRELVTDDHRGFLKPRDGFTIASPISYYGKHRTGSNARYLHALAFDIDGQEPKHLRDLIHQMQIEHIPMANYIVNSGNGVHVYYVFDEPIPLFPQNQKYLRAIKHALTGRLWNLYTSKFKEVQYQGIMQGFRLVGSTSKLGKDYPVCAYRIGNGEPISIQYLLDFIPEGKYCGKQEIRSLENAIRMPMEEAKEKYPEWYQRRIVEQMPRGYWICHRGLYDWWMKHLLVDARVGHRYFCVMALAIYGRKCNIPSDEVRRDAFSVMGYLDSLTQEETNHFTEQDVIAALEMYNEDYITFPRREIEKLTGVSMPANKRNGRKQEVHLKIARTARDADLENWREGNGRPTEEKRVKEWRENNPWRKKADCIRETGLSKKTVYKYW